MTIAEQVREACAVIVESAMQHGLAAEIRAFDLSQFEPTEDMMPCACRFDQNNENRLECLMHKKQRERAEKAEQRIAELLNNPGCLLAGPGRGDCEHFIGLPGKSIPGQHDGPDTVDVYGKPNGWCWSCWKDHKIAELERPKFKAVGYVNSRDGYTSTKYEGLPDGERMLYIAIDDAMEGKK